MKEKTTAFRVVDVLLLVLTFLPIVCGMVLKILFTPPSEGIQITGALIYFEIPMPVQNVVITEAQVNAWLVMAAILFLCLYLTHGLAVKAQTKRQLFVEWVVEKSEQLTTGNMGDYFLNFAPFVAAILALSAFSSLLSLFGLYAPTSDINVVAGWAILTFALITYYKFKAGPVQYLKSFGDPVPFLAPRRVRDPGVDGLPSLRQHPLRLGHLGADRRRIARAVGDAARMDPGDRQYPDFTNRSARCVVDLF